MTNINHKSKLSNGLLWTIINKFSLIIVQFVGMTILARFIEPNEFALMGIALFFINIANLMVDSGLGGSLVGKHIVLDRDYSTLFIYNVIISVLLSIIFYNLSPVIANFYSMPELASIVRFISIQVFLISIGKVHNVILTRNLKFKELGLIAVISQFISLIIAIYFAINGYGVWALLYQNLSVVVLTILGQYYYCRFIPKLMFDFNSFKDQCHFGLYLFGSSLIQLVSGNIYQLVFPKVSSLRFSGLYTQASKLQMLPITTATSIIDMATFPILSKMREENNFIDVCRTISRLVYFIIFSVLFVLLISPYQLIEFILGSQWTDATDIFRLLLISSFFLIIQVVSRNILKSKYMTSVIFKLEIFKTIIIFLSLLCGLLYNETVLIYTILFSSFWSMVFTMYIVAKRTTYILKDQISDIIKPLIYCFGAFIITCYISEYIQLSVIFRLIVLLIIYYVILLLTMCVFKNKDLLKLLSQNDK